jgi:hypothetical protein
MDIPHPTSSPDSSDLLRERRRRRRDLEHRGTTIPTPRTSDKSPFPAVQNLPQAQRPTPTELFDQARQSRKPRKPRSTLAFRGRTHYVRHIELTQNIPALSPWNSAAGPNDTNGLKSAPRRPAAGSA